MMSSKVCVAALGADSCVSLNEFTTFVWSKRGISSMWPLASFTTMKVALVTLNVVWS